MRSNMATSVRARLNQRAKNEGRPFQELLQHYGLERFLYRLSRSVHGHKFILKGTQGRTHASRVEGADWTADPRH